MDTSALAPMPSSRSSWRPAPARPDIQRIKPKATVYSQGQSGPIWRVAEGAVALEFEGPNGRQLAGLALQGDLIGAEQLVEGDYAWSARALLPCQLLTWRQDVDNGDERTILRGLVAAQRRSAALLALRSGTAQDRVIHLIRLLCQHEPEAGTPLPTLRDMSLITTISHESICRELARLRAEGRLSVFNGRHVLTGLTEARAD